MISSYADCRECISEFVKSGGCECLASSTCDPDTLIPSGCMACKSEEDEVRKLCASTAGI